MRKGDIRTIRVGGEQMQASFLGKGNYATCWRVGDTVYSFVNEEPEVGDFAKGALSLFCAEHPQIPRYTAHGNKTEDIAVYSSPFYEELTPKHKQAWAEFRYLAKVDEEEWSAHLRQYRQQMNLAADLAGQAAGNVLNRVEAEGVLSQSTLEALQAVYAAGSCYGSDVRFEFAKRNLKVNAEGKLLLLDVLFSPQRLEKQRRGKRAA